MSFLFGKSNKSDPPPAGQGTSNFASGAEQDRYASHFGIGDSGVDKIKEAAIKAATYKGVGAEQDRYATHFHLDQQKVLAAAQSMINAKGAGSEQDRYESHFGLGADGLERARRIAAMKGTGAEQDRYGSHFGGLGREDVRHAAQSAQQSVKDSTTQK